MWQRFKDVVDSTIKEEQARQQQRGVPASSPRPGAQSRSSTSSRNQTPTGRRRRDTDDRIKPAPTNKEPDPSEFEADFSVADTAGEDAKPAALRSKPETGDEEKADNPANGDDTADKFQAGGETQPLADLPLEVKLKLKKWDQIQPKYSQLLASYRVAHERNKAIAPFEAALRENTPLTTIGEPAAFIEYLNQINLKATLLMEELKKVTTQRDELKSDYKASQEEIKDLKETLKSRSSKPEDDLPSEENVSDDGVSNVKTSNDLFSYDEEVPRLQAEVESCQEKIKLLEEEKSKLATELDHANSALNKLDQSVRRLEAEHTQTQEKAKLELSDVSRQHQSLQSELNTLRERSTQSSDRQAELLSEVAAVRLELADERAKAAASTATERSKHDEQRELDAERLNLQIKLQELEGSTAQLQKRNDTLTALLSTVKTQLNEAEKEKARMVQENMDTIYRSAQSESQTPTQGASTVVNKDTVLATSGNSKRKNKKKKGGKNEGAEPPQVEAENSSSRPQPVGKTDQHDNQLQELQAEITKLRSAIDAKDAQLQQLRDKIKDQETLEEEIEGLKDDLMNVGQDHVEFKDKYKTLLTEKLKLETEMEGMQKQLAESESTRRSEAADRTAQATLASELQSLRTKAAELGVDLEASQQLASSRFKELTVLRESLQKLQIETTSLRSEVADLRKVKDELNAKTTDLRRVESREKELRDELATHKSQMAEARSEIRTFMTKVSNGEAQRTTLEETLRKAQRDLQRSQTERKEFSEQKDKLSAELKTTTTDLKSSQTSAQRLEQQIGVISAERDGLRGEVDLRGAQYASAQSLMNSMQDQAQEISAQMKEVRERCESLEEELADAHRLLNERGREAETMRRLMNEADSRVDARLKEMRERMEIAIEERDRAEEQASSSNRKRAKELEELRSRVRDSDKALVQALEERDSLMQQERDNVKQKEEAERKARSAVAEVDEVKHALTELKEALEETENQSRELEDERSELKRALEDSQVALEDLQKSSKALSNELRALKQPAIRGTESSRSSFESSRSGTRISSPISSVNKGRIGSIASTAGGAQQSPGVDYVYLKNVLLQFLEQKDKKHQMQLVPVLGMLLHFDKQDEQKWASAISAR